MMSILAPVGLILAVIASACFYIEPTEAKKNIVCYYANWPQYRPVGGKYTVGNVDPFACTHLIFAFAKIVNSRLQKYEQNDFTAYSQLVGLRNQNPKLLVLLAVGGWNHGPEPFTEMARTKQGRTTFIENALQLLRKFDFDGIDLDWEYPGKIEPSDKGYLTLLLQEMRMRFQQESRYSGKRELMMAMAVAAGIKNAEKAYDVPVLNQYLDMINVMTYDFHGAWEKNTGLATPLQSNTDDLSVMSALNWYIGNGASRSKINLGVSFYARTWTLANSGDNRLGAPTLEAGKAGPFTREPGALSYYEICQLRKQGLVSKMDDFGKTMYGVLGKQFVTYEDTTTLPYKLDIILQQGLAGAMVWALDHDDFNGQFCGEGKNPLLTVVKNKMEGGSSVIPPPRTNPPPVLPPSKPDTPPTLPPSKPDTPPTLPPDPNQPGGPASLTCVGGKVVPDKTSCRHYYVCSRLGKTSLAVMSCPHGDILNPNTGFCEDENISSYRCPHHTA